MHQFRVKSEIQTLRTESGVDSKSDSGFLGVYLQHICKNQPWLLWENRETARNLHALISRLIQRPYNSTNLRAVVKLCDRLVQISDSSCTTSSKTASM